jgi:hypothetical protein
MSDKAGLLVQLMTKKKAAIVDRWLNLIMNSYPAETSRLLKQKLDQFTNPVGYTISKEIPVLYQELFHEMRSEVLLTSLGNIIRILSIQDFAPSHSIAFIIFLKKAIRDELADELKKEQLYEPLLAVESRIDELVLLAMGVYAQCREKVHEIRVNEARAQTAQLSRLLERINQNMGG